ncbi:MAG: serine/threonine protein kinase, partial [Deltaproteobacteria bacterium]
MNRNEQATGGRRSRDEKGKTEVRKNRFENTWSLLRALAAPPASGAMLLLEPGTRIAGRYEIVGTIGKGGMGTVYCARDSSLDRKVAIKFQRPVSGEQDTFGGSAEATSLARLSHPNVVTVHETGRFEQHTYIVMEYVDGMTLAEWLRHGKRSLAEVVDMFLQAGRGLQAVHSAGLVHLDFKPANVLIGKNGIAKVVDFGLSLKSDTRGIGRAPASSSTDGAQVLGRIFGTPAYMAPEQILGEQVDARTDQFAFCVALFEAVHGRRPFEADTLEELLYEITRGRVNKAQGRKVPSWLNGILDRGLSADPAERFPDMKTLVAELERGPRAARRKILAAAASVVLAAGMAAGAALHSAGKPDPCGQAPSDMAAVWNARARDEIKKNIKAGGEPGWEKTYGMVKSRLDGFGKKWQRIYRSSCEATKVYHAQSEQALELTAGCLRGKLGEFAEMVDVLQSSPGLDFRKVSDMTGVLPDPSECARTGQLRRLQALPADRAERKAIAAASKAIYRAWLLARSGRLDEARKILDSQSHEGFHGHLPLQARWTYVRAEVARAASRSSDAERFLRDAVALAAASGDDELLSKSMSDLAFVISNSRAGDGE